MATYAIGDIQGCYDSLQRLLAKCAFDPAHDRLWLVGDLVNRGPKSLETLRLVKSFGASALTVLGNHDLYLLMVAEGGAKFRGKDDTLQAIFDAPDCAELLDWLRHQPLCHTEGEYCLVHAGLLGQGKHVAVFPEGTTTDGRSLLHFHAALLQPALAAGRPVLPAAISYWELDGQRSLAPRYDGDISLGECTRAILGRKRLIARLVTTPLRGLNGEDRRVVAAEAREAIALAAGLPMANNPPETPGDLPVAQRSDDRPINSPSRAPADSA